MGKNRIGKGEYLVGREKTYFWGKTSYWEGNFLFGCSVRRRLCPHLPFRIALHMVTAYGQTRRPIIFPCGLCVCVCCWLFSFCVYVVFLVVVLFSFCFSGFATASGSADWLRQQCRRFRLSVSIYREVAG